VITGLLMLVLVVHRHDRHLHPCLLGVQENRERWRGRLQQPLPGQRGRPLLHPPGRGRRHHPRPRPRDLASAHRYRDRLVVNDPICVRALDERFGDRPDVEVVAADVAKLKVEPPVDSVVALNVLERRLEPGFGQSILCVARVPAGSRAAIG
jgi:hypothetical protein